MKIKNLIGVLALTVAGTALSTAATLNCGSLPGSQDPTLVSTVGVGSGNVCSVTGSNATFSNFTSEWNGTATSGIVFIQTSSTLTSGSEVLLGYQLSTPSTTGDLLLQYQATGIEGVDFTIQASPASNGTYSVTMSEIVCSVAFVSNACPGVTLANIGGTAGTASGGGPVTVSSALFSGYSTVYIKKDLTFNNAILSEFVNSQAVPEPMTLSMMGLGLIGLGFIGRKIRK